MLAVALRVRSGAGCRTGTVTYGIPWGAADARDSALQALLG